MTISNYLYILANPGNYEFRFQLIRDISLITYKFDQYYIYIYIYIYIYTYLIRILKLYIYIHNIYIRFIIYMLVFENIEWERDWHFLFLVCTVISILRKRRLVKIFKYQSDILDYILNTLFIMDEMIWEGWAHWYMNNIIKKEKSFMVSCVWTEMPLNYRLK